MRVLVNTFLVLAGVFAACVASASADAPIPPNTQIGQVAKRIIYNGLDMHATVFQSALSQQQVVDFYKQKWGKEIAVNTIQASKVVGHLEGGDFITVQVTTDGAGSKGTIGVLTLPLADAPHPQLGEGLPQPFGAKVINDISYPDDRTPARTVLMIDQLDPDQNATYFRSRLIANGWKDANVNACAHGADHCAMEYQRGKSRMMFVAQVVQGRSEVLMNILNPTGE